jgi:hypothetical protein
MPPAARGMISGHRTAAPAGHAADAAAITQRVGAFDTPRPGSGVREPATT